MSLSLWPPNPMPPVDILILIVAAVGSVLAVRKFIYDLRHPLGRAVASISTPPQVNGTTPSSPTTSA